MKWIVVAVLVLCTSGSARADATAEARARYHHGLALFNEGRFEEARAEFEAGYDLQPLPLFLFNAAQAARRAGERARALDLYKRFVAADPESSQRAEADQHIAELAPAGSVQPAQPGQPQPPAPQPSPQPQPQPSPQPQPQLAVSSSPPPPSAPPHWSHDVAGGVLLGVGVAAVVAGATLTGVAGARLDAADNSYDAFDSAHHTTPLFIAGGVTLGVATICLVGSAIRYSLVARRRR
jgi:tetratricopeptide (TPR) repeat protein